MIFFNLNLLLLSIDWFFHLVSNRTPSVNIVIKNMKICRGVGTILILGGPNIDIQGTPLSYKKLVVPNYIFCFISTKYWVGLGPPSPYPYYAPDTYMHTYVILPPALQTNFSGWLLFEAPIHYIHTYMSWNCSVLSRKRQIFFFYIPFKIALSI